MTANVRALPQPRPEPPPKVLGGLLARRTERARAVRAAQLEAEAAARGVPVAQVRAEHMEAMRWRSRGTLAHRAGLARVRQVAHDYAAAHPGTTLRQVAHALGLELAEVATAMVSRADR